MASAAGAARLYDASSAATTTRLMPSSTFMTRLSTPRITTDAMPAANSRSPRRSFVHVDSSWRTGAGAGTPAAETAASVWRTSTPLSPPPARTPAAPAPAPATAPSTTRPPSRVTTRSATCATSARLCSTTTAAAPLRRHRSRITSERWATSASASPDAGSSSSSRSCGRAVDAARSTMRRMPVDRSPTRVSRCGPSPNSSATASARSAPAARSSSSPTVSVSGSGEPW